MSPTNLALTTTVALKRREPDFAFRSLRSLFSKAYSITFSYCCYAALTIKTDHALNILSLHLGHGQVWLGPGASHSGSTRHRNCVCARAQEASDHGRNRGLLHLGNRLHLDVGQLCQGNLSGDPEDLLLPDSRPVASLPSQRLATRSVDLVKLFYFGNKNFFLATKEYFCPGFAVGKNSSHTNPAPRQ